MKIAQIDNLHSYDKYIVGFSGGKDSIACLLAILDAGVDRSKIELWHHNIDGGEGGRFMDWNCTESYCKAFAKAFEVPLHLSWREGGFEREMTRTNQLTGAVIHETPTGIERLESKDEPELYTTRNKYPAVVANLQTRWCSAALKIDVMARSLRNQPRFNGLRTLVITGERGQESTNRQGYAEFEPHACTAKKRHVDHYRPVKNWDVKDVWAIIEKYKVNVHPAYKLGFGRVSCLFCIFGNSNQFASAKAVSPQGFEKVARYETMFGHTIKNGKSIREVAAAGTPYPAMTAANIKAARSEDYNEAIILDQWIAPAGVTGETCGSM